MRALPPILVLDRRIDMHLVRTRLVQRVDNLGVALGDHAAAHFARPRHLVVVRIELLVQQHEALHLRDRR